MSCQRPKCQRVSDQSAFWHHSPEDDDGDNDEHHDDDDDGDQHGQHDNPPSTS